MSSMKIIIPSLILIVMIVAVLLYYRREDKKTEMKAKMEMNKFENELKQTRDDLSRDNAQLESEKETRHLLFQLDYTKEKAEKYIVEKEDSMFLNSDSADIRWYNQFKKRYHPTYSK